MNTKKFKLFMGCLGNGITVCNAAIMENGDYKHIAHIRETGYIKWYVDPAKYVPVDDLIKIEHDASVQSEKWEKWFSAKSEIEQISYLYDRCPLKLYLDVSSSSSTVPEKIMYLKQELYKMDTL